MIETLTATVIVSLLVSEEVKEGGKYLSKSPRDTFTQLVNTIREKFKTEGTEGLLTRTLNQPTEVNKANLQGELQTQIDADSEFANKLTQLVKQLQRQDKNLDNLVKQNSSNEYKEEYKKKVEEIYGKNGYPLEIKYLRELKDSQNRLKLSDKDAKLIEEPIKKKFYDLNQDEYKKRVSHLYKENGYPLKPTHHQELNAYRHKLGLEDEDAKLIQRPIEEDFYKLNLHRYSEFIKKYQNPNIHLDPINFEQFQVLRESLGLRDEDTRLIERVIKKYKYFEDIFSGSGSKIDYWKLRNLLVENKWKEANQETKNLILNLAGRQKQGYVKHNSLQSIEERDMFIIDQLWVIYSDKRFGFTVQAVIFDRKNNDEELFAERVGWKRNTNALLKFFSWKSYEELNFKQNAPEGHLPTWGFQRINFLNNKYYCTFCFYICRLFKIKDPLKWIFLSKYFKKLDYLD